LLEDLLHGEQIAHINSQDSWGRTPLHAAATTDNSRCLEVLLQAGGMFTNFFKYFGLDKE
jgi:ankyrin repeat protein